jgi:adenylate cyclase
MELTPRLRLMNWLVHQGLTGLPENDLIRGFCQRCRAEGLPLSRGLVFIDTLHPIFEGRGVRWNDAETNESDAFEYGSTSEGDAAQNWRRTVFHHLLEHGQDEIRIDLAECEKLDFSMIEEIAAKGHRHFVAFVHRFGEAGTMGQMDCLYSYWTTRRDEGFDEQGLAALRDLVPVLGLAIKSHAHAEVARTLGRVYLGRDASEQVLRGKISRGVTEKIKAVLWFSDVRGSTAISESLAPDEIIPFLNDYAQASIDAIHDSGGEVLKLIGDGVLAMFTHENVAVAQRPPRRRGPADDQRLCRPAYRPCFLRQYRQRGPARFHRGRTGGERSQPHRLDVLFGRSGIADVIRLRQWARCGGTKISGVHRPLCAPRHQRRAGSLHARSGYRGG